MFFGVDAILGHAHTIEKEALQVIERRVEKWLDNRLATYAHRNSDAARAHGLGRRRALAVVVLPHTTGKAWNRFETGALSHASVAFACARKTT
jgi:hypothetical protein